MSSFNEEDETASSSSSDSSVDLLCLARGAGPATVEAPRTEDGSEDGSEDEAAADEGDAVDSNTNGEWRTEVVGLWDGSARPVIDGATTTTFADFEVTWPRTVVRACAAAVGAAGGSRVSAVQAACWCHVGGEDLVLVAPTGSGKSLAFLLPAFATLVSERRRTRPTEVVVLAPTRELCEQLAALARAVSGGVFGEEDVVRNVVGGVGFNWQGRELEAAQPRVLVATPGRLLALCGGGASSKAEEGGDDEEEEEDDDEGGFVLDLASVRVFIGDEAERLLDHAGGFEADVLALAALCPQRERTLLATATPTPRLLAVARALCSSDRQNDGAVVTVKQGCSQEAAVINARVTLKFEVVAGRPASVRDRWLRGQVAVVGGPTKKKKKTVVFALHKHEAKRLAAILGGVPLHGDMSQAQRREAMDRFRKDESCQLLVATDIAARGLDVRAVARVVSLGVGLSVDAWVHRVGRCARFGDAGVAVTSIDLAHEPLLPDLVDLIDANHRGSDVPQAARNLAREIRAAKARKDRARKATGGDDDDDNEAERRADHRRTQRDRHAARQQKAHAQQKKHRGRGHRGASS